jgi:hypothetical protein
VTTGFSNLNRRLLGLLLAGLCSASLHLARAQNIFVANLGTMSVWQFDPGGNVLTSTFGMPMAYPAGLALRNGELFVAYGFNETKVARISADGTVINPVFASGLPSSPSGMKFDSAGNLYVISGTQIAKFNSNGALQNASYISGLGNPWDLAFDGAGNLYVAESTANKIAKYSPSGQLLNANYISGLNYPTGLAFDGSGNLYVVNYLSESIAKYGPAGNLLAGDYITGLVYFPENLAFDPSGNLFVSHNGNGTISKYGPTGNLISAVFASGGSGAEYIAIEVPEPSGLAVLGAGFALVLIGRRLNDTSCRPRG